MEHKSAAAFRSRSGGGGGPFGREVFEREESFLGAPVFESREVEESFASLSFNRSIAVLARGPSNPIEGRTRRFCLLGGRISSRSTGTPRLTRKRRRIRERVQLGGCIGGGETSCCQRERERSERKGDVCEGSRGEVFVVGTTGVELGRMALM